MYMYYYILYVYILNVYMYMYIFIKDYYNNYIVKRHALAMEKVSCWYLNI